MNEQESEQGFPVAVCSQEQALIPECGSRQSNMALRVAGLVEIFPPCF